MRKVLGHIVFVICCFTQIHCGSVKDQPTNLDEELTTKNRSVIPLKERIRKLRGIKFHQGVPVLTTSANSFSNGNPQPLYVLNGQIIGKSYESINELIDNNNVKSVKLIKGADAAYYGAQGANGVILITTYKD